MADAAKAGKGAVSLDGRLIDIASIRMAEALLKKAAAMGACGLRGLNSSGKITTSEIWPVSAGFSAASKGI